MILTHRLPAHSSLRANASTLTQSGQSTGPQESFISSPAGHALGGAILGAVPIVGALSNFYGCMTAVDSSLMHQNGLLGCSAVVAGFAGMAANLAAISGGAPWPVALGLLGFSAGTSALNAYLDKV